MANRNFAPYEITDDELAQKAALGLPIPDECALSLGTYVETWSQLESATGRLTASALGTDLFRGALLADRLQPNQLRELLTLTASNYLTTEQFKVFTALSKRWQVATGVRNRLIHGRWVIVVFDTSDKIVYERQSHIWDRETAMTAAGPLNKKAASIRNKHAFSVHDIYNESKKVYRLANDILSFLDNCVFERQSDTLPHYLKTDAPLPSSGKGR